MLYDFVCPGTWGDISPLLQIARLFYDIHQIRIFSPFDHIDKIRHLGFTDIVSLSPSGNLLGDVSQVRDKISQSQLATIDAMVKSVRERKPDMVFTNSISISVASFVYGKGLGIPVIGVQLHMNHINSKYHPCFQKPKSRYPPGVSRDYVAMSLRFFFETLKKRRNSLKYIVEKYGTELGIDDVYSFKTHLSTYVCDRTPELRLWTVYLTPTISLSDSDIWIPPCFRNDDIQLAPIIGYPAENVEHGNDDIINTVKSPIVYMACSHVMDIDDASNKSLMESAIIASKREGFSLIIQDATTRGAFSKDKIATDIDSEHCTFINGYVNHRTILTSVDIVIHHGGVGTTTGCIVANVPFIIIPHFVDQFHHADWTSKVGISVGLPSRRHVNEMSLQRAMCNIKSNYQQFETNCKHVSKSMKEPYKALMAIVTKAHEMQKGKTDTHRHHTVS